MNEQEEIYPSVENFLKYGGKGEEVLRGVISLKRAVPVYCDHEIHGERSKQVVGVDVELELVFFQGDPCPIPMKHISTILWE